MFKKFLSVLALGLALVLVTAPVTYNAFSQAAPIRGEVSAGVYENLKSDGSGHLLVVETLSGVTPAAVTYTTSSVTVTSTATQLWPANTSRKVLIVQNNDTTGDFFLGFSPTTITSGIKLLHGGGNIYINGNAPTNALVFSGTIASNANVSITEGQ
jgi:hypothetical protein